MVKLLACGERGPGSIHCIAATISEIGDLLLLSRDLAEMSLKRRKSSKQPTNKLTKRCRCGNSFNSIAAPRAYTGHRLVGYNINSPKSKCVILLLSIIAKTLVIFGGHGRKK